MQEFLVKQESFEGPLDLLLDLIEKRKLHVSDVSLASVTDDFVAHVKEMEQYSISGVAHFVLIASTLLLIKSKALLPNLSLTEEESADIKDLEERLRVLQKIRELSTNIKDTFGKKMIFSKSENKQIDVVFSPDETISLPGIKEGIMRVLASIPIKEIVPQAIVKKVISLEEMIERLVTRVQGSMRTSFKQFAEGHKEKVNVIVGFLAMLELVKQGVIAVTQDEHFADIDIETAEVGVPRIV